MFNQYREEGMKKYVDYGLMGIVGKQESGIIRKVCDDVLQVPIMYRRSCLAEVLVQRETTDK